MTLTPDEEKRVQAIAKSERPRDADVLWLCELVERLSRATPTEWNFPKFAALFSPTSTAAFGLRYAGLVRNEQGYSFRPGHDIARHRVDVFTEKFFCAVCDAILCIRPYIRMESPPEGRKDWMPSATKQLRAMVEKATIRLEIDDVVVIDDEPAEAYLIGLDGAGLRRHPSNIRVAPDYPLQFYTFEDDFQVVPSDYGVFIANNSMVKISILGLAAHPQQRVVLGTGLVMARYTTSKVEHPHHNPEVKKAVGTR